MTEEHSPDRPDESAKFRVTELAPAGRPRDRTPRAVAHLVANYQTRALKMSRDGMTVGEIAQFFGQPTRVADRWLADEERREVDESRSRYRRAKKRLEDAERDAQKYIKLKGRHPIYGSRPDRLEVAGWLAEASELLSVPEVDALDPDDVVERLFDLRLRLEHHLAALDAVVERALFG